MRGNLFGYGTSELTQDAFVCWIISRAAETDSALKAMSRRFVEMLFGGSVPFRWDELNSIDIRQQKTLKVGNKKVRLDVAASFTTAFGDEWLLIVEDKLMAAEGTGQLASQVAAVEENRAAEWPRVRRDPRYVFLKSGYDFDWRVPPPWAKVSSRNLSQWLLTSAPLPPNDILAEWHAWYRSLAADVEACTHNMPAAFALRGLDLLKHHHSQYLLLKYLFSLGYPDETAPWIQGGRRYGERFFFGRSERRFVALGSDFGIPFAQYWFHRAERHEEPRFFFRVHCRRSAGWALELRHYYPSNRRTVEMKEEGKQAGHLLLDVCGRSHIPVTREETRTRSEMTFARVPLQADTDLSMLKQSLGEFVPRLTELQFGYLNVDPASRHLFWQRLIEAYAARGISETCMVPDERDYLWRARNVHGERGAGFLFERIINGPERYCEAKFMYKGPDSSGWFDRFQQVQQGIEQAVGRSLELRSDSKGPFRLGARLYGDVEPEEQRAFLLDAMEKLKTAVDHHVFTRL